MPPVTSLAPIIEMCCTQHCIVLLTFSDLCSTMKLNYYCIPHMHKSNGSVITSSILSLFFFFFPVRLKWSTRPMLNFLVAPLILAWGVTLSSVPRGVWTLHCTTLGQRPPILRPDTSRGSSTPCTYAPPSHCKSCDYHMMALWLNFLL